MSIGVEEFARRKNLSPRRVRALIEAGDLTASRVGRTWAIDEAALAWSPRRARPLSRRTAWAVVLGLSGQRYPGLAGSEVSRLHEKLARVKQSEEPAETLRSWLPHRASRRMFLAAPSDLADLRADARVVLSGVDDPRSQISSASLAEGYVAESSLPGLADDFLLIPAARSGSVILHVYEEDHPIDPSAGEYAFGRLVADLSEHPDARAQSRVRELLEGLE